MKSHEPMAVFKNTRGRTQFITERMVMDLLRGAASATLNLQLTDPEISLWSTHSVRVTAANLLYCKQLSDNYRKTRLHWKSNTFLMYLRNTIYSTDEHSKAASGKLLPTDLQQATYQDNTNLDKVLNTCTCSATA